ncbi:TfoX/Sxy family protein [Pseudomonadota bacterium]
MIDKLRNLGKASASMLKKAGITTEEQLQNIGAARAYVTVKQTGCSPSLNLLWALEGALTDRDWKVVAKDNRLSLLIQAEELEKKFPNKKTGI